MKLHEIKELNGTYAGYRFSTNTKNSLYDFINKYKIPNKIDKNELHTTLLYSTKNLPNYKAAGKLESPYIGIPKKFFIWDTKNDDGDTKLVLVLTFKCPELVARHKELMKKYNAKFDFSEYKPHVTLSYDVGKDFDITKLDIKDFPDLELETEYGEDLNLNY